MQIGNLKLYGRVLAAPLAGVSDRPFRRLARSAGAALVYTEMISAEGIIRDQGKTWTMAEFSPDEQPIGIQLFGSDPDSLGKAAEQVCARLRPDLLDLNLGCPVRKVVNKNGGAAMLKDLALTRAAIRAMVDGAGETPVTVKLRTGWDEKRPVYVEAGEIAQACGAAAVTLHARSRSKGFAGAAEWSAIRRLKEALEIPVIGNGDVRTPMDARRMLDETGCDAVMVGRASMTNPLVFKWINAYLETGILTPEPSTRERIELARRHARLVVDHYGPGGVIRMRKWLAWYVKGFRGAAELRSRLVYIESLEEIDHIFDEYLRLSSSSSDDHAPDAGDDRMGLPPL